VVAIRMADGVEARSCHPQNRMVLRMALSEGDHCRRGVWWPPDSGGSQTANIKGEIIKGRGEKKN